MQKEKNYLELKKLTRSLELDLFGVADVSEIKRDFLFSGKILEKINSCVCAGFRLSRGVLQDIENEPTRLYFHHYRSVNSLLDQAALKIARRIEKKGYLAVPVPASQIIDWQNQKAHLSHKKIGLLAGLGWIGRNNLLVNKRLGSDFRLVSILTDMPLKTDRPVKEGCGECVSCVKVCPAGAIKKEPSSFDHLACFNKLKEFQKKRLVDQYICGVCVRVCKGR